jgi:hypothetical protein
MTMTRRTWEIIIIVTAIAVDVLKLFKDKFKNGGKKNDSTRSTKKK